jgi:hypothetical protein
MNLDLFKSKVIMTSSEYLAFAVGFVLGAVLVGFWVNYSHTNYKEVVKTNIGEFIISEGKIFTVYEMERSAKGDIQVGIK